MESGKFTEKYSLVERLAEGSYGQVFKGQAKATKQPVAIKRFKGGAKVGLPTSFVREHYILTCLPGPFVPRVLDVFPNDQPPTIVMEWLSLTLEQVLKQKRKYSIKQFTLQMLQAVDHLHDNGVIHRDLKPSNIMLGRIEEGISPGNEPSQISPTFYCLKFIDFGMARQTAWESKDMTNKVGTLYYRAPELIAGDRRYSFKIDVWSIGCIFYFMQTGCSLFKGTSETDQFKTIITVLGADIDQVTNEKIREALIGLKMEKVPENWQRIEKTLNEVDFQFLKRIVVLDPQKRPSCKQLLQDPYFHDT